MSNSSLLPDRFAAMLRDAPSTFSTVTCSFGLCGVWIKSTSIAGFGKVRKMVGALASLMPTELHSVWTVPPVPTRVVTNCELSGAVPI